MTNASLASAHQLLEASVARLAVFRPSQAPQSIHSVEQALEQLYSALAPSPVPPANDRPAPKLVLIQSPCNPEPEAKEYRGEDSQIRLRRPIEDDPELEDSEWDPEPIDEQLEASRCRAFLLEIVRRAVYDWVLYRQHDRLELKQIAADAYTWLFEEEPGHPWFRRREQEERHLTSLHAICEALDLEPKVVRERARHMDIRTILTAGRPPEIRRREVSEDSDYQEYSVSSEVDLANYGDDPGASYYENHYSVPTAM